MKTPTEVEFERFIRQLRGRGQNGKPPQEIAVEAGHIYIDEEPGDEHIQSLALAAELSGRLIKAGIRPIPIMLIDDYNPAETKLCRKQYLAHARGLDFDPVEVIMESDLIEGAKQVIAKLAKAQLIKHDNGVVTTTSPKILLKKTDGKLSCSVLDAALYCHRFQKWPFSITILPGDSPRRCQNQQRHTRKLLRLLGYKKLPLANIYFRRDGQPSFSFPA